MAELTHGHPALDVRTGAGDHQGGFEFDVSGAGEDGAVGAVEERVRFEELDGVLGTEKFKIKSEGEEKPFEAMDKKLAGMKGRKSRNVSHLPNGLGEAAKAQAILAGGERGAGGGMDW